ncbi:hypothetical protein CVU5213_07390 [Campylobacter vulpis]|uniref:Coiled-coil domain-containing protein n=1 Tax=Campylobacter vulpis TaxID=1655500 RepID=A0ABS5P5H8_9BACT|nr:hypothetical protein [Campylobacter vulpis]MBS4235997.1 hypothetical protein [Campylobacter vulpis]MBS4241536.1 hypothetical protein [Campylobacter vulpis]MBS4269460.1 hypothetical protein [Campylobacter vulpis]
MDEATQSPLNDDEARLAVLENEISQAEASLEQDFAKYAVEKIASDESLEELYFEDKEEFIKQILHLQNEFLKSLQNKVDEANELRGQIGQKKAFDNIQAAADAFDTRNLGVSSDELLDFFQKDLSPRAKANLESLEPSAFFEELYKLYEGENKTEESEELPQRLNASSASVESGGDSLVTQRF